MGMPGDHFRFDARGNLVDSEPAFFSRDSRQKEDLEEKVSELFPEPGRFGGVEGLEDLVGFLQKIGLEGREGLLAIPRALPAQPFDESDEAVERVGHVRSLIDSAVESCRAAEDDATLGERARCPWPTKISRSRSPISGCLRRTGGFGLAMKSWRRRKRRSRPQ